MILPVLNERACIPDVLAGLPPGYRPVVVDNGSTDGSGDLARALGAVVIVEPRRGFGAACWAGLQAATDDIVCFMDCDGSFDGQELPLVVASVLAGRADLVLGRRRPTERGAWPPHARLANRFLAHELGRRCRLEVGDIGPMRAARRAPLLELGIEDRRFGWPLEMVMRAARAGWRVEEIDVSYHPRTGRSKVTGTVMGTVRAVRDMARVLA